MSAPTGFGKSACSVAVCRWAEHLASVEGSPGGYIFCTQKLLQDQYEKDILSYKDSRVASLKSASEYKCCKYENCAIGSRRKKGRCPEAGSDDSRCPYKQAKNAFFSSPVSITNYAYLFTERAALQSFPTRKLAVFDECHSAEKGIISFIDLVISEEQLDEMGVSKFLVDDFKIPENLSTLDEFMSWVKNKYVEVLRQHLDLMRSDMEASKADKTLLKLDQHVSKIQVALGAHDKGACDWVFWKDADRKGKFQYIARPLDAAPFAQDLLFSIGTVRIYMSAWPGAKSIFCKSLGLIPEKVAWLGLTSTFPVENRPIYVLPVGSMGKSNFDKTLPSMLKVIGKILTKHKDQKGIIHSHSYRLGEAIHTHFKDSEHGPRILYPTNGDDRIVFFNQHIESKEPTVILSPSMTEGFDFHGHLARFAVLAKVPYASLGDKQVAAKLERNPEWYSQMTAQTIVQACGRIVRSETDHGICYILDADFLRLWSKYENLFPKWFRKAVKIV